MLIESLITLISNMLRGIRINNKLKFIWVHRIWIDLIWEASRRVY